MRTASLRLARQSKNRRQIMHCIGHGQPAWSEMSYTRRDGVSLICCRKSSSATMRAAVQRVSRASVTVDGRIGGEITDGLMILLGVGHNDSSAVAVSMAE